jgi:hypothetical protein
MKLRGRAQEEDQVQDHKKRLEKMLHRRKEEHGRKLRRRRYGKTETQCV